MRRIQSLVPDQLVSLKARILKVRSMPMGRSQRRIWEVVVNDSTGRIACKYFRVPYKGYFERFQPLQEVRVIGKVTRYRGVLEFHHPDIHPVGIEEEDENVLIPDFYMGSDRRSFFGEDRALNQEWTRNEVVPEILPPWILAAIFFDPD